MLRTKNVLACRAQFKRTLIKYCASRLPFKVAVENINKINVDTVCLGQTMDAFKDI